MLEETRFQSPFMKSDSNAPDSGSTQSGGRDDRIGGSPEKGPSPIKTVRRYWRGFFLLASVLVALAAGVALYQTSFKPLPDDVSLRGVNHPVAPGDIEFLFDLTGMKDGRRISEQMIFDRALRLMREAQDFVVVDLFLFNEYRGKDSIVHRQLCREVVETLLENKRNRPEIHILVITDPVNEVYGGAVQAPFQRLREAGIPVVVTDLRQLRDSNPLYSSFWRIGAQWLGNSTNGWLPHPFGKELPGVSVRSWLALLNFKANHRKLVIADAPDRAGQRQMVSLVMSANPHDASSAHSNVGLLVRGGVWRDLLRGEQAILDFSGAQMNLASWLPPYANSGGSVSNVRPDALTPSARVLTEGKIREEIVVALDSTRQGDAIDVGMFYLAERKIIGSLIAAAQRGATIRVLLDPNRDAFGRQKNGIPNRPVAAELLKAGGGQITVRWFETHGEQFHSKMVLVKRSSHATLFAGSANLTRRNVGDLNLETDLAVTGRRDLPAFQGAEAYFERAWTNRGLDCTVPYEAYADPSPWKYWAYRVQEATGLSTF